MLLILVLILIKPFRTKLTILVVKLNNVLIVIAININKTIHSFDGNVMPNSHGKNTQLSINPKIHPT